MARFIQIIQYSTSRFDEVQKLSDEFRAERAAAGIDVHPIRVTTSVSRDDPNRYTTIAEFGSYGDAMTNSNLPETQRFAASLMELCDGPPTFHNLDVIEAYEPLTSPELPS
ncbi:MAG TPA: hypothetical protein VNC22_19420 [Sporichthya sp.]|jgi:hypothetical protein|nr:hypothetical protein [Sporichthya sp.]